MSELPWLSSSEGTVTPVAEALRRNVPFVVASAFSPPDVSAERPWPEPTVGKPLNERRLLADLGQFVES